MGRQSQEEEEKKPDVEKEQVAEIVGGEDEEKRAWGNGGNCYHCREEVFLVTGGVENVMELLEKQSGMSSMSFQKYKNQPLFLLSCSCRRYLYHH